MQRLAETVRQLGPPALKEGIVWLTRAICVAPSHANGPEGTGGATRAATNTTGDGATAFTWDEKSGPKRANCMRRRGDDRHEEAK